MVTNNYNNNRQLVIETNVAEVKFDWSFLDADLSADVWKTVMYSEVLDYHESAVNSDDVFP
jgi:p38 MAP kinase